VQSEDSLYPVQKALLAWLEAHESGYPVADRNFPRDRDTRKGGPKNYRRWIASNLGVSDDSVNRYFNGSNPIGGIHDTHLLAAMGWHEVPAKPDDELAHMKWEVGVVLGLQVKVSDYSAVHDQRRAKLAQLFPGELKDLLPPASSAGLVAAQGTVSTPATSPQALTPNRQELFASAVDALDDQPCTALVRELARQARHGLRDDHFAVSQQTVSELLTSLRALATKQRAEPIDALNRALLEVPKRWSKLEPEVSERCREAARLVFALLLMDYAIAVPANLAASESRQLHAATQQLVGAVLVLDDATGTATRFSRVPEPQVTVKSLSGIDIEGLMTDCNLSGITPFAELALRGALAQQALIGLGQPDRSSEPAARGEAMLEDDALAEYLRAAAAVRNYPIRIALNLASAGSAEQLAVVKKVAGPVNLPVVTYGAAAPTGHDWPCDGQLHAQAKALAAMVDCFLAGLDAIGVQPKTPPPSLPTPLSPPSQLPL